jgi:hypothetical protein
MCDLAYVNLLREKVRQSDAEQKRIATSGGGTSSERFVPWVMQSQAPPTAQSEAKPAE